MCGRFVMTSDLSVISEEFHVREITYNPTQSYNIAPGNTIAAIVNDGVNRLVPFKWGLIPSWAKDQSIGNKLINARGETVGEKPSFRAAFGKRRCLIVANGFYEWQKTADGKIPFYVGLKSDRPFGFAGLFETWMSPEGKELSTCTIITTEANDLMKPIHDRMPVIVPKDQEILWLEPGTKDKNILRGILAPYPHDEMKTYEVSPLVNSPRNNSARCIHPVSDDL